MRTKLLSLGIMMFCLIGSQSGMFAQTVYVNSSTGNDGTGTGSSGSPYKTFTKGYSMVSAGGILDLTGTFTWTDAAETGDVADDGSGTQTTNGFTINKNISIKGHGANQTIIQAASSSGAAACRLFYIPTAITVTFQDLELRYGKTTYVGGAIRISDGSSINVTITNCYIHDNIGTLGGGAIRLESNSVLTITNSTISTNSCSNGNGGGIEMTSTGTLTITNSTICNNTANMSSGGGLGAGIYFSSSSSTSYLTNCTITGNSVNQIYGGGICQDAGTVYLKNNIIANNTSSDATVNDYEFYAGTLVDNGYNIIEYGKKTGSGTGTFSGTNITGNQSNLFGTGISASPSLALNNSLNGTPTLALSAGSVAINAGNATANGSVSIPTTDQRGLSRVGATEIGAYEFGASSLPTVTSISPTSGSTAGGTTVTITGTNFTNAATVKFGVTSSSSVTFNSSTSLTATSPAGSTGAVDVTVITAAGTSATSSSDQFTYLTPGTFTGATNDDWATAANWAGGSVPGSGTDVTIPSDKTVVIGTTTTAASKNLTVNAGGSLTIQSSVAGTGSLIISGTTSGSVTVERYMAANAWQLIAPSASGQTIGAFLTSNSIIKENPGNTANKAIKDYNESTNAWNGLTYTTSSTDLLGSGKGYAVWPASSGVVRFSGTLTAGSKSVTVAKSAVDKGWNCIGNPYTSAVAINSNAGATNFINENLALLNPSYAAIYVWEQSNNAYTIINQSSGSFYATVGQGFFANAASGNPVGFTAAMQTHQTTVALRSVVAETPTITLQASLNGDKRTAEVKFLQQSSRGLDIGYDAGVMKTGFDIYTNLVEGNGEGNGVGFGIQCLPIEASVSYAIPVVLESTQGGSVELKGTTLDLPSGYTAYLEDRQNSVIKELTEDGLALTVSINAGTNSNRFYLTVGNVATGIKEVTGKLTVSTSKGEINLVGKVNNAATAALIDLQGRVLKTISLNDSGLNQISTTGIQQGIYLLKIQEDGKAGYQTKVIVKD